MDNEIARISVQLVDPAPEYPADRIIAATAISLGAVLITKDAKLRGCKSVRTAW